MTGEGAGYVAMIAFLVAYLLSVADAGHRTQTVLNLLGAGLAGTYLYRKGAIPFVISNIAWGAITLAGAVLG